MWDRDKSLLLSIVAVRIFFVIWIVLLLGGYTICSYYAILMEEYGVMVPLISLVLTLYLCLLPAFVILYDLNSVLMRIRKEEVFIPSNVYSLRRISWSCIIVASITVLFSVMYVSLLFVAVAFAFLALLIRVIKNIFVQAMEIKKENDYTI